MSLFEEVLQRLLQKKARLETDLQMAHDHPLYQHKQQEEIEHLLRELIIHELMIARYSEMITHSDERS